PRTAAAARRRCRTLPGWRARIAAGGRRVLRGPRPAPRPPRSASKSTPAQRRSRRHRFEKPAVVAMPVAAPAARRVELALGAQELHEPRMRRLHLFARRPAMVGEVVAAAARQG